MYEITINTQQRTQFIDITETIKETLRSLNLDDGVCYLYVPHTTAAVTINENDDPAVARDILMIVNHLIPFEADYQHLEGNSAAHIKASLIGPSEVLLVEKGEPVLGRWQGIFFCEFDGPRTRKVWLKVLPSV